MYEIPSAMYHSEVLYDVRHVQQVATTRELIMYEIPSAMYHSVVLYAIRHVQPVVILI